MDVCYDSINLTPEIKSLLISGTSTICWPWEAKPFLAIKTFVILRRNHKKWNTLCVVIIAYIGLSCRMDRLLFKMNEFWELLKELIHPKLWAFYCFQAKAGRFSDAKEEFCKLGQENLKPFFSFFFLSFLLLFLILRARENSSVLDYLKFIFGQITWHWIWPPIETLNSYLTWFFSTEKLLEIRGENTYMSLVWSFQKNKVIPLNKQ